MKLEDFEFLFTDSTRVLKCSVTLEALPKYIKVCEVGEYMGCFKIVDIDEVNSLIKVVYDFKAAEMK